MQLLRRAIDLGPAVLCHVEGSQGKRIPQRPKHCAALDRASWDILWLSREARIATSPQGANSWT